MSQGIFSSSMFGDDVAAPTEMYADMDIPTIQATATRVVRDYLQANPACDLHIQAFNLAVKQHIPHIIDQQNYISWVNPRTNVEYQVQFTDVFFKRPAFQEDDGFTVDITPLTCIERKLNYMASVNCTAIVTSRPMGQEDAAVKHLLTLEDVTLFQFPIIVGSSLCHTVTNPEGRDARLMDNKQAGGMGCFIVKGNEKVMIMQEKLRGNVPIVRIKERSNGHIKKVNLEFRSCHEMKMRTTSTLNINLSETNDSSLPKVEVQVQFLSCLFSVCGVFCLLKCDTVQQVLKYLLPFGVKGENPSYVKMVNLLVKEEAGDLKRYEEFLLCASPDANVDKASNKTAAEQADAKRTRTINIMSKECFPHVEENFERKRHVFGLCVRRILRVYLGLQKEDDRDSKVNIRSTDCGVIFSELLRLQFTKHRKNLIKRLIKETMDGVEIERRVYSVLCDPKNIVTQRLITAVNNGNFASNTHEPTNSKKNVTQQLIRPNFLSVMSHLRKESKPINRDGKSTDARQLDPHSWGFTCSTQTPEGNACGLLSTVCMLVSLTVGTHSSTIIAAIDRLRGEFESDEPDANFIFVNGIPVWRTSKPVELSWAVRDMRCITKEIPFDTEVAYLCYDKPFGEIRINCDIGNHMRPVLRTDQVQNMMDSMRDFGGQCTIGELWRLMLDRGIFEYVGPEESVMDESVVIAESFYQLSEHPDGTFSHVEIDAAISLFGPGGTVLAFPNMNQGPRNTYQLAMSAQAMSSPTESGAHRMETQHFTLHYPQRPIGTTAYADCVGEKEYPTGQMAVVAIAPFFGSNTDDGKTINKSSCERGFGMSTQYRTYQSIEGVQASNPEFFGAPDPSWCTNMKVRPYPLFPKVLPLKL